MIWFESLIKFRNVNVKAKTREERKMKALQVIFAIISLLVLTEALSGPFLERIYSFNGYTVYNNAHQRPGQTRRPRTEKPRGRSFKDICRFVNPAPYSFPNKIPYPSVPIC